MIIVMPAFLQSLRSMGAGDDRTTANMVTKTLAVLKTDINIIS
jgi:hypothetical protein